MELNAGVCNFCNTNNEVFQTENFEKFWELLSRIFEDDIPDLNDYKTNIKVCPTCLYKITLIDSKKAVLLGENSGGTSADNCGLCNSTESGDVLFKVGHSKVLKDCKSYKKLQELCLLVCGTCYFVIDSAQCIKGNMNRRVLKSRGKQPKQKTVGEENAVDNREEENKPEVTNSQELENEEKENETMRTPTRKVKSAQINGQNLIHKMEKTPSPQSKKRTNNKSPQSEVTSPKAGGKILRERIRLSENATPKIETRSSPRKIESQIKGYSSKAVNLTKNEKESDFDLSKLVNLVPLSKMKMDVAEKVKIDVKLFRSIPFVKMKQLKQKLIGKKAIRTKAGPNLTGKKAVKTKARSKQSKFSKRTPPIRIKFKANKNKRITVSKFNKKKLKTTPDCGSGDATAEREVLVKVSQLSKSEQEEKNENKVDSDDSNQSLDLSTPKKKKKVHFNDTPTIIVDFSDPEATDEEEPRKKRKINETEELQDEESDEPIEQKAENEKENEVDESETMNDEDSKDEDESAKQQVQDTEKENKSSSNDSSDKPAERTTEEENNENNDVIELDVENENAEEQSDDETVEDENGERESKNDEAESKKQPKNETDTNSDENKDQSNDVIDLDDSSNDSEDKESKGRKKDKDEISDDDLQLVDNCDDDDTEETTKSVENGENIIVLNNELLSEAAADKDNSLIGNVEESSTPKDQKNEDSTAVEIHDDDSLSCLDDLSTFTKEVKSESDKGSKRASSSDSDKSPKKARN